MATAAMCGPKGLKGARDHLFRNTGDGTFADVKNILKKIFDPVFFLTLFLLSFLHPLSVYSQADLPVAASIDDALEEELKYLKAETYVITASRLPENIKKSASSIAVITDKEIRQMGARHLAEVLQTVPGMYYFYGNSGTYQLGIRGDMRNFQNVILVMVNGHPINEGQTGAATFTHDTMILDNVKRIEVIRGPGSALYGANAFAGVVNVITKGAEDVNGWELTAGGGTYDTQQYNLLYGKTHNDLNIVFNYNYFNTHGFRGLIEPSSHPKPRGSVVRIAKFRREGLCRRLRVFTGRFRQPRYPGKSHGPEALRPCLSAGLPLTKTERQIMTNSPRGTTP